jgi:hypothetical protein
MARPKSPEPLQPGDEQIAREQIEGYYTRQVETARAALAAAQERFAREQARAEAAITAFRAGGRLPELDAWSIEVHAGGHGEIGLDIINGRSNDRAAYDRAKARSEATNRWLRHEGYESVDERGRR